MSKFEDKDKEQNIQNSEMKTEGGSVHKQEEGNGMNLKRTASMKVKPGTRLSMDVLSVAEP